MNDRTAIDNIKADPGALCAVLGVDRPGNHCPCRFCGSRDALSVSRGESGWYFKCHHCGAGGDVVTALELTDGIGSGEAIQRLTGNAWTPSAARTPAPPRTVEPVAPVPDRDRVRRFMESAVSTVFVSAGEDMR